MSISESSVPWSAGSDPLGLVLPTGATDCHHHVYDARWPVDPRSRRPHGDASLDDYRRLQRRLGTSRHVIVQPSLYGTDNQGLLTALGQCPPGTARGVAVADAQVSEADLDAWHATGVRGLRFNLLDLADESQLGRLSQLAKRIAPRGWHVQVNASALQIVAHAALWRSLPCAVVFDHLGHLPQPAGVADPAFALLVALMQEGWAWVKLSGLYNDSRDGAPGYADACAVAAAFVRAAPRQVVWGSDWPHPTESRKPDDAQLLRLLLLAQAPGDALRRAVLVDNPARLYDFP